MSMRFYKPIASQCSAKLTCFTASRLMASYVAGLRRRGPWRHMWLVNGVEAHGVICGWLTASRLMASYVAALRRRGSWRHMWLVYGVEAHGVICGCFTASRLMASYVAGLRRRGSWRHMWLVSSNIIDI